MQEFPTTIIDELELWELVEIPDILTEGQILEEYVRRDRILGYRQI